MPSRRATIAIIGGGLIVAAGAAIGLTAFPPGLPDPAAAWTNPGNSEADIRRRALAYAILAPNPHNMQPWRVDLSTPDVALLSIDRTRLLAATDPFSRQIVLGCGAFLELLELAANALGARLAITPWPQGQPGPVLDDRPFARVVFSPAPPAPAPLFRQITARRTNRADYDLARPPRAEDLAAIAQAGSIAGLLDCGFSAETARVAALRDLVWRGWLREAATPATLAESVDVMRIGDRAVARDRDGISLPGPLMNLLGAAGLMSRAALLDPASQANRQGVAMWRRMAETAPAFIWQVSADNSRTTQLLAGRAYARLTLEATARGLATHPWSMTLQEYPEMAELYAAQQAALGGTPSAPVQMLARIGYAAAVPPAPRRGLAAHIGG